MPVFNRRWLFATIFVALFALSTSSVFATTPSLGDVKQQVFDAFKAVSQAEEAGGDVSPLVADLNGAIEILERVDRGGNASLLEDAMSLLNSVLETAPSVAQAGVAAGQMRLLSIVLSTGLLAVAGFIAYRYIPVLFWRLWVRSKRNWKVRT